MSTPIRVLLIEDNPGDADLVRETLEDSRVRLDLDVACDGVDALAYLLGSPPYQDKGTPDLILLDLNLPRLDGKEVLKRIREHEQLRLIPVVILTSSDAESDIVKSYQLGASCYLTKPVGLAAFQEVVRSIEGFWLTVVKLP